MKTLCKTGFSFDELSDTAKETVKQWYLDDDMRGEFLHDEFENSYLDYFFHGEDIKVQWSLSSCQGDGVNIYGTLSPAAVFAYIRAYNPAEHNNPYAYDPRKFTDKQVRRLEWYSRYLSSITLPTNSRYCYSLAYSIDFADDLISDLEYDDIRDIDRQLIHDFEDVVKDIIGGLCSEMEHNGYEYLYNVDDEEVSEMCAANEWYFDEAGHHISGWRECI